MNDPDEPADVLHDPLVSAVDSDVEGLSCLVADDVVFRPGPRWGTDFRIGQTRGFRDELRNDVVIDVTVGQLVNLPGDVVSLVFRTIARTS